MPAPKVFREIPSTPQFPFVFGRYTLSNWRVPFYATSMTLKEAAENLRLVTEFPGSESQEWQIDELYQRDLDWSRVNKQIVPYLRSEDQAQFFNALTIALVPVKHNKVIEALADEEWTPPKLQGVSYTIEAGPIVCGYYGEWEVGSFDDPGAQIGQIRWNKDQVFAVAIDGQHRLAALKELVNTAGDKEAVLQTRVPVLLLPLARELGFERPDETRPIVQVLRRLFIDLNKHAKSVKRSRNILLDDLDPTSLCVRALVGKQLRTGRAELDGAEPVLPLTLVDWHSEQAKFEDGPYVTTILGLDWIVTKTLQTKPIADSTDYARFAKQLKSLSRSLGIDFGSPDSGPMKALKEAKEREMPFTYAAKNPESPEEDGDLATIVSAFKARWVPSLVHVLTEFSPYRAIIDLRAKNNSLSAEFINWYYLYARKLSDEKRGVEQGPSSKEYYALKYRLLNRQENSITEAQLDAKLKECEDEKQDSLAFNVVFQRAMILAFLDFAPVSNDHINDIAENDDDDAADEYFSDDALLGDDEENEDGDADEEHVAIFSRAKQFVDALNRVLDKSGELLDPEAVVEGEDDEEVELWGGSILGSGTIDFTQGASSRAKELILWIALLALCEEAGDPSIDDGFDAFWDNLKTSDLFLHKRLRSSINRYCNERTKGSAWRILKGRSENYSAKRAEAEARSRFYWVWQQLGLE